MIVLMGYHGVSGNFSNSVYSFDLETEKWEVAYLLKWIFIENYVFFLGFI